MLSETADLMEISAEDPFRIRSYRTAAGVIEGHPEQLSALLKDPAKKLTDIAGIGKGIAAVIAEIEERGSFERRDEMLAKYPASLLELLSIQGLGSKSIRLLYDTHKVQSVDDLERVCREQKLRELPRMGAKLEEKVLRSIASYRQRQGRFLLSFAERAAEELVAYLSAVPGVEKVTPAGSLRRSKETVGDLDLLVTGPGAAEALEKFVVHPRAHEVLWKGPN
jgi:DNA polymerase (family 10)